jgi:hypothetical protein
MNNLNALAQPTSAAKLMQIANCKLQNANRPGSLHLFNLKFEICNCQFAINKKHIRKNNAFTLLEILLSLALSVLVLMAVGMAINLHLRLLDSGRTKVEEAQLARAILRNIAQDLRSAVPYNAANTSGGSSGGSSGSSGMQGAISPTGSNPIASTASSPSPITAAIGMSLTGQAGKGGGTGAGGQTTGKGGGTGAGGTAGGAGSGTATGTGAGTGTGTGAGTGTGTGTSTGTGTESDTDSEDRTSDIADAAPQSVPGLYGNPNQIQVDISRLPRVDQYIAISNLADGGITNANLSSDIKNVSYFVINNGASSPGTLDGTAALTGLVRREMSRAAGVFASQQSGQLPLTPDALTPIAPEVMEIDFQYTDGTQWLDTWDTVSYGGLPVAVQVSIIIAPLHSTSANAQPNVYRLLVSIPAAKPAASQTTSSTSSTPTASTTQTNTQ